MRNTLLLLAVAGLASACNRQASNGTATAPENRAGTTQRTPHGPDLHAAATAERDIRALLDQIYAPYASDNAPGREIGSFMEPQLAAAMAAEENGPNADPFIDAQDYAPFRPDVGAIRVDGDRAEATVRFTSLSERTIAYRFLRTPGGWKVADIRGPNGGSLRAQYGLPALP